MRAAWIPLQSRHSKRLRQNCLPQCRTRQGRRVEARKRMERIPLHVRARDSRIEESKVEGSVMTNEDCASAVISMNGVANLTEYATQCVLLRQRRAQWMEGINASDRQRRRVEASAFEWFDVKAVSCAAFQRPVRLHVDEHSCDFQQRIRGRMKPAGFNVDHDGKITAESA